MAGGSHGNTVMYAELLCDVIMCAARILELRYHNIDNMRLVITIFKMAALRFFFFIFFNFVLDSILNTLSH